MSISSFTRLGSASTYQNAITNLQERQASLASLQENLTSGLKITSPSDDPTGAAKAERALTRISRIASDQRALQSHQDTISQAEGSLGDVTTALQSFRDLVVSAGNAGLTPTDRQTIVKQLSSLRDQIFAISNKTDSNGQPLFGALGSSASPFTGPQGPSGTYTFNGLPGTPTSTQTLIPSALDGNAAFMNQPARDGVYNVAVTNTASGSIPSGRSLQTGGVTVTDATQITGSSYTIAVTNVADVGGNTTVTYNVTENPNVGGPYNGLIASYPDTQTGNFTVTAMPGLSLNITGTPAVNDQITVTPGTSLFGTLDTAINDIGKAANPNAASQAVSQALGNIDIGLAKVSAERGRAGDLLTQADRITANNSKLNLQQQSDRSSAQDLDMVKGLSDFQAQQTGYSAALQSYAQVQKLSLFNYLG
jgi:flagellar hook-associated protein 3 FlgL